MSYKGPCFYLLTQSTSQFLGRKNSTFFAKGDSKTK